MERRLDCHNRAAGDVMKALQTKGGIIWGMALAALIMVGFGKLDTLD
jgi:hypothetical protein